MTGLVFKLYATGRSRLVGSTGHYGAAIDSARLLTRTFGWRVEVWATDTGGRGVPVEVVYVCG
jgi:hypothetical protein